MLNTDMDPTFPEKSRTTLKPLVVFCFPETPMADAGEFLPDSALLAPLEIAVSFSAAQRGLICRFGKTHRVFSPDEADILLARVKQYDLVVVSPLSLNTLAKFALGIRDSFPTGILGAAVEAGLPILLSAKGIPGNDSAMNPHFLRIYRRHWQSVLSATVKEFTGPTLDSTLGMMIRHQRTSGPKAQSSGRSVITRDDVLQARESLAPLRVSKGAIITDLALEEAKAAGVRIEFE